MRKFQGLTMEQHLQMAADLLAIQDKVHQILMLISKTYGVSRKVTKSAVKLENKVKDFKSDMDTAFFNDINPDNSNSPYYPK